MADTSVPSPTFGPNGFVAPSEADVLVGVQADIDGAFGGGLNPGLSTPQGQLASSQTAIIGDKNATFIWFCNQVDPAFSSGRMQDAIARIYFIDRIAGEPTVVQATCSGLTDTVIHVGSLARAADGNLYVCQQAGTITAAGSVVVPFVCAKLGPIVCEAGQLNTVYQAISGWDSITNAADGVLGRNVESRSEFETRRSESTAINSTGQLPAILGAVLAVPNVIDAYATENVTDVPLSRGGIYLAPHSLYVAALGGIDQDIADAIWSRKAPGCNYTGNTTIVVVDPNPAYVDPRPTYDVTFERPVIVQFLVMVVVRSNTAVPPDAQTQVQDAVIGAFAGTDGGSRARIGSTVLASRFYGPVTALGSWAQIVDIQVSRLGSPASIIGSISGSTLTVTGVSTGVLAAGDALSGSAVTTGTTIIALGTGTGGVGTYVVAPSQTLASGPLLASPLVNFAPTGIAEYPAVSRSNIYLQVI